MRMDYEIMMRNRRQCFVVAGSVLLSAAFILVESGFVQNAKGKAKERKPNPAMAPIEDVEGLPRVLPIGDSISIG